jgi:hypothetical protein
MDWGHLLQYLKAEVISDRRERDVVDEELSLLDKLKQYLDRSFEGIVFDLKLRYKITLSFHWDKYSKKLLRRA